MNKQYPVPYGYKVTVQFDRDIQRDIVTIIVNAPFYKKNKWYMPQSYSTYYSDEEILNDDNFKRVLKAHYESN